MTESTKEVSDVSTIVKRSATIFLLTTGTGADGDEWGVESIHTTRKGAEQAKEKYEAPRPRGDGTFYSHDSQIEEWTLEE